MTSGKSEYWARWAQEGEDWQGIFRHIDPALASFAEANQMELRRWHWDVPDRTLTWSSEGLQRNLHVYLDGEHGSYSVVIEGSAWMGQWDNGKGQRSWRSQEFERVGPGGLDERLGDMVASILKTAFEQVRAWGLEDMKQKIELSR